MQHIDGPPFGALLRRHRVAAELSQEELAARAHLSARAISDLERDVRHLPQPGTLIRLIDALDLEGEDRTALEAAGRRRAPRDPDERLAQMEDGTEPLLLESKLTIPIPHRRLIPRPRLTQRLRMGLQGPLTLLAAPVGYGKTSLLTAWHATPEGRTVALIWISLDAGDNDAALFWSTVFTALDRVERGVGTTALAALHSSAHPSMTAILGSMANRLHTRSQDVVLVLDDYHVIDTRSIHEALTFLLEHLPPSVHLVISSRTDPPLPLARMRARGALVEVRAEDLRFSQEEAATFLTDVMGLVLSREAVSELDARTEGWIAGLQLAALSLQGRSEEAAQAFVATFTGSQRHVLDYLMDEVLSQQPEPVQAFLMRTSILDRISAPLAAFIMYPAGSLKEDMDGTRAAQELLEQLEHRNAFVVPLDEVRRWYRYHQLFRDALRQRLGVSVAPDDRAALHRRASIWLAQHDLRDEAIDHALAGGAFDDAASLITEAGWDFVTAGTPFGRLRAWLRALPEEAVWRHPRLCILQAHPAIQRRGAEEMEAWLARAEQALAARPATEQDRTMRGEIAGIRATVASLRGNHAEALVYGEQALELLDLAHVNVRGVALFSQVLAYVHEGDLPRAAQGCAHLAALARAAHSGAQACVATNALAYVQRAQGLLRKAMTTCHEALVWCSGHDAEHLTGPIHMALADVLREQNDLSGAQQHMTEAVRRGLPLLHLESTGQLVQARIHGAREEWEDALSVLEGALRRSDPMQAEWDTRIGEAVQVQVRLRQGRLGDALHWMDRSGVASRHVLPVSVGPHHLVYAYEHLEIAPAQILLAQGRAARDRAALMTALDLLRETRARAETAGLPWLRIKTLALQALAQAALGAREEALESLQDALDLAAPEEYRRVFLDEGEPMAALLSEAAARDTGHGYAHDLLSAARG